MTHRFNCERLSLAISISLAFSTGTTTARADTPSGNAETTAFLEDVTVTSTREGIKLKDAPASVSIIKRTAVESVAPAHPQELLRQVPGVALSSTNGEGHTTAIRQPFNTSPVYLFLEDGIPIRATGFFNHNALYEINLPQAGGVEVVRGLGSALYGSDAIGGIINVLTRAPEAKAGGSLNMELGSYGWKRILGSANTGLGDNGAFRADINLTHTDGWRDKSAYDRQSLSLRWDNQLNNGALLKTIVNYTKIDQETGAGSNLSANDYQNNPTKNYFGIAFRKVEALRMSTNYEQSFGDSLLSITPYLRDNSMDLFASFTLSSDPTISHTENKSYGLLTKWRTDFPSVMNARLIAGLDLERSPGARQEDSVQVTRTGSGVETVYSNPRNAQRIFDYSVVFKSVSPYLHGEISPTQALRLTAGLRYDKLSYDMNNNLTGTITANGGSYALTPSANPEFSKVSPKLGFAYALNASQTLYGSYNEGFRAPSESQLFRASRASIGAATEQVTAAQQQARAEQQANSRTAASLALNPIKAHQFELGLRGQSGTWNYDTVVYALTKKDDLTSVRDPADINNRININAGETSHLGVELALGKRLTETLRFDSAVSYSVQRYEENITVSGNSSRDFSGKDIPSAPRVLGNTILTWQPMETVTQQLEWVRIGSYYLDDANTTRYSGHSLLNLRSAWQVKKDVRLFARLNNLTDRRYAESASLSTAPTFSPGLPRTLYAGVDVKF